MQVHCPDGRQLIPDSEAVSIWDVGGCGKEEELTRAAYQEKLQFIHESLNVAAAAVAGRWDCVFDCDLKDLLDSVALDGGALHVIEAAKLGGELLSLLGQDRALCAVAEVGLCADE
jgi:hypothetical protein